MTLGIGNKEKYFARESKGVKACLLTVLLLVSLYSHIATLSPIDLNDSSSKSMEATGAVGHYSSSPIVVSDSVNVTFETSQVPYLWFSTTTSADGIYVNVSGNYSTNDSWVSGTLTTYTAYDRCTIVSFAVYLGASTICDNPSLDPTVLFSIDFLNSYDDSSRLQENLTLMVSVDDRWVDDSPTNQPLYNLSDGDINADSTNTNMPNFELGSGVNDLEVQGFFESEYDMDYLNFNTPFRGTHRLNLTIDRDVVPSLNNGFLSDCEISDNSGFGMVKDIAPGGTYGMPSELTKVGDMLYFRAEGGTNGAGTELWKSDGTYAGTVMVKDIDLGSDSGNPAGLTALGNMLYFLASDGTHGQELWKSDGTSAGTVMVKDIYSGANSGGTNDESLTVVGNTLYFQGNDGTHGRELWKSDGTSIGTVMVKDIYSGSGSGYPQDLTAMGNILYFQADDGMNGYELWKSDGTDSGTTMVRDIGIGWQGSSPSLFTPLGNTLFFKADDGMNGTELWKSDGTESGTVTVRDISSGWQGSSPSQFTVLGNTVYFRANDGMNGYELWKSDGTDSGTTMVKNINEFSNSMPSWLAVMGNMIYFSANDGMNGYELWKSDGTDSGTVMIKDIDAGYQSGNPQLLTAVGNTLYFSATDAIYGTELWMTDGTESGTHMVKDIYSGYSSSSPGFFTGVGDTLYFSAIDYENGRELFSFVDMPVEDYEKYLDCLVNPSQGQQNDGFSVGFSPTSSISLIFPASWNATIQFNQVLPIEDPTRGDSDGYSYAPTILAPTSQSWGAFNFNGDRDRYAIPIEHGTLQQVEIKADTPSYVSFDSIYCGPVGYEVGSQTESYILDNDGVWNQYLCDTRYISDEIVFFIQDQQTLSSGLYPEYNLRLSTDVEIGSSPDIQLEKGLDDAPSRGAVPSIAQNEEINGSFIHWSDQTDTYGLILGVDESVQIDLLSNCAKLSKWSTNKASFIETTTITYERSSAGGVGISYGGKIGPLDLQQLWYVSITRMQSNDVHDVELKDRCTYTLRTSATDSVEILNSFDFHYDGRMHPSTTLTIDNLSDYLPLHKSSLSYSVSVPLDILPTTEGYLQATQASNEPVGLQVFSNPSSYRNIEYDTISIGQNIDFGNPYIQWNELEISGLDGSELTVSFVEQSITHHTRESSELFNAANGALGSSHDEGFDGTDQWYFNNTGSDTTFASVRMTSLSDDLVTSISGSGGGNGKLSKFICFGQHTNPNVIVNHQGGNGDYTMKVDRGFGPCPTISFNAPSIVPSASNFSVSYSSTTSLDLNIKIYNPDLEMVYASSSTNSTQLLTLPDLPEGPYYMLLMDSDGISYHEELFTVVDQPYRSVQSTSNWLDVDGEPQIRILPLMHQTGEPMDWEFTNITLRTVSINGQVIEQGLDKDYNGFGSEVIRIKDMPTVLQGSNVDITGELIINGESTIHTMSWKVAYFAPIINCETEIEPDSRMPENDILCKISFNLRTHGSSTNLSAHTEYQMEGTLDIYNESFSIVEQIEFSNKLFDETSLRINSMSLGTGIYFTKLNMSSGDHLFLHEEVASFEVGSLAFIDNQEESIGVFELTIISVRDTAAAGDDIVLAWSTEGEKAAYFVLDIYSSNALVDSFSVVNNDKEEGQFKFQLPDDVNPYLNHQVTVYAFSAFGSTSQGSASIQGVNQQDFLDVNVNPDRPSIGSTIDVELMLSDDANWMSWTWTLRKSSSAQSELLAQGEGFAESNRAKFDFKLPFSQYTSSPYLHILVEGIDGMVYSEIIKIEPVPLRSVNIIMDSEMVLDKSYNVEWSLTGQYLNTVDDIDRIEFSILTMDYESYHKEIYFVNSDSGEFETLVPSTLNPGSHRVLIEFTFADGETYEHSQIVTVLSSPNGLTAFGLTIPPLAMGLDTILVLALVVHAIFLHRRKKSDTDSENGRFKEEVSIDRDVSDSEQLYSEEQEYLGDESKYNNANDEVYQEVIEDAHDTVEDDAGNTYPMYQEYPTNSGNHWVRHHPEDEWQLVE